MKKKMIASFLVGSAVIGASLAPLSAQAVTKGDTPVQVEFGGGTLDNETGNAGDNTAPDPVVPNTNFDLLKIPKAVTFNATKISGSLQNISSTQQYLGYAIGDLRGTKEGWHVTASATLANGSDILVGNINFKQKGYYSKFDATKQIYVYLSDAESLASYEANPTTPDFSGTNIPLSGDAITIATAGSGKGQGLWYSGFGIMHLEVTTPYQLIKAGAYTGNITWNLVAGPTI
ncbi:WxL domain-containing protein [Enterococcus faecalis]|uniref:WxL domain-containing protein n=1 Tax=Enterococcus faecalis TaxID=1351 RepID=UPI001928A15A|nr:WxL domain-containing protein [Enterococcus faecalis]EGO8404094.1 WxL domain-containing protein [Enterococcus faecalis]EGO8898142.1 WxL domain-containing protein [Enterococcus faecalis]EGO9036432.1 WxL domain-containing protein [Enterococcus faecalis]EGO9188895.1 WxL domain-containing protein [Enterococcus faecalis]EIP8061584.1 WxL domain-containing protein [Enterococcus faecalis]